MKKVVMAVGAAILLSGVGSLSEAKTNTTDSAAHKSHIAPDFDGVSLPILYGVMGVVMVGALGSMTYLFLKPANK
jgi:hypothetical protein